MLIEAKFCKDENVLYVRRASQKFGLFVYFISVAVKVLINGYTWDSNACTFSRALDKSGPFKAFRLHAM